MQASEHVEVWHRAWDQAVWAVNAYGLKTRPLLREELHGLRLKGSLGRRVDPLAPGTELGVEVGDVHEGAPRIEVMLDVVKGPLHPCRPVRIAELVRRKAEAHA